jgi:hypothetical protein
VELDYSAIIGTADLTVSLHRGTGENYLLERQKSTNPSGITEVLTVNFDDMQQNNIV